MYHHIRVDLRFLFVAFVVFVAEGFRWALVGPQLADVQPAGTLFAVSVVITVIVLASGAVFLARRSGLLPILCDSGPVMWIICLRSYFTKRQ